MNEQSDHIVSSFDDDIASIRMSVIKMATLVEEQYKPVSYTHLTLPTKA